MAEHVSASPSYLIEPGPVKFIELAAAPPFGYHPRLLHGCLAEEYGSAPMTGPQSIKMRSTFSSTLASPFFVHSAHFVAIIMATTHVRFDNMFLVGIWVESVLYGMNFVIFLAAMYVLIAKRRGFVPIFLITLSILLFAFSTAHVALGMRQLQEAFILGQPGTASIYFANLHLSIPNTKLIIYSLNVCTQDLILIWKLWAVWGKKWWIAAPFLVVEVMHTSAGFVAEALGSLPGTGLFDKDLLDWALANWTLDLFINITCTALIAFRFWHAERKMKSFANYGGGNKYTGVILTMIESGTLFCVATVVLVGLYLSNNVATFAVVDSVTQLATITPLLIIVRVGLNVMPGERIHGTVHTPNLTEVHKTSDSKPSSVPMSHTISFSMGSDLERLGGSIAIHSIPEPSEESLES
ncbi:hypothetical protein CYLTODRAFT_375669 [Cylindrobasidium torrendii FP15055 ss-10]|uniref:Uncharacterized protein n=1 Tax=Cylindrobasidium torrendii FP15055 ss-10 TaxID=1314674 RepID=A0A0D7BDQ3_9AGAR|nr:hypothetical protein CYLTODRAFT_375669 [Cylindrobasidium torrendii FP15055 ss-10]